MLTCKWLTTSCWSKTTKFCFSTKNRSSRSSISISWCRRRCSMVVRLRRHNRTSVDCSKNHTVYMKARPTSKTTTLRWPSWFNDWMKFARHLSMLSRSHTLWSSSSTSLSRSTFRGRYRRHLVMSSRTLPFSGGWIGSTTSKCQSWQLYCCIILTTRSKKRWQSSRRWSNWTVSRRPSFMLKMPWRAKRCIRKVLTLSRMRWGKSCKLSNWHMRLV